MASLLMGCFPWMKRKERPNKTDDEEMDIAESPHAENLYPTYPPPPPQELLAQRDHYKVVVRQRRYAAPKGEPRDTPLYTLYRLYEKILLDNNVGMRNELEYFWSKPWPVNEIPDPQDESEPARYAVLACIPALIVESFNKRYELGLRREGHSIMTQEERQELAAATPHASENLPSWVYRVAPLKTTLYIPHEMPGQTQLESLDDERASPPFKEKNILIWHPHIHFV